MQMDGNQQAGRGQRGSSVNPATSKAGNEGNKSLNPKAPEFKPSPQPT